MPRQEQRAVVRAPVLGKPVNTGEVLVTGGSLFGLQFLIGDSELLQQGGIFTERANFSAD